ncbi:MAG: bacterial Ig-like domain-containing protein [Clostridia bacterium]|nr:bacterial Ig-like domain-containing protein [Clostridia bacterium]
MKSKKVLSFLLALLLVVSVFQPGVGVIKSLAASTQFTIRAGVIGYNANVPATTSYYFWMAYIDSSGEWKSDVPLSYTLYHADGTSENKVMEWGNLWLAAGEYAVFNNATVQQYAVCFGQPGNWQSVNLNDAFIKYVPYLKAVTVTENGNTMTTEEASECEGYVLFNTVANSTKNINFTYYYTDPVKYTDSFRVATLKKELRESTAYQKGVENYFDIDLTTTLPTSGNEAIVLLFDLSSSMNVQCANCGVEYDSNGSGDHSTSYVCSRTGFDGTITQTHACGNFVQRLAVAKTQGKAFIDKIAAAAGVGQHMFVELVTFDGTARVSYGWVDVTVPANVTALKNAITNMAGQGGGTNISEGMKLSYNELVAISSNSTYHVNKESSYVVLLSDGAPTGATTSGNAVVSTLPSEALSSSYVTKWKNVWSKYNHYAWHEASEYNNPSIEGYKPYTLNQIMGAPYYSEQIKNQLGGKVYSVVFGNNMDANPWNSGNNYKYVSGNSLDNKDYVASFSDKSTFTSTAAGLDEFYTEVAKSLTIKVNSAVVTDPMSAYVDFIGFEDANGNLVSGNSYNGATYNSTTKTISWNRLSTSCTSNKLSYRVRLKNEMSGFVDWTDSKQTASYVTNGETKLVVGATVDGQSKTEVDIVEKLPEVHGWLSDLSFTKVGNDGKKLAGAEFTLQHAGSSCTVCHGDATISNFTATSDSTGKVTFKNIPSGHIYTLKETKAPTGYGKAADCKVTVSFDNITVTGTDWNANVLTDKLLPAINPDVIVVDYGKTILCSPLTNDPCSTALLGIGATSATTYTTSYKSQNGVFKTEGNNVIFSPFSYMSSINRVKYYASFKDASNVTSTLNSTITVIPATTVYYEDNFGGTSANGGLYIKYSGNWKSVNDSGTQSTLAANTSTTDRQDRGEVGAGHVPYGYDSSYQNCTKFSNGTAAVVTGTVSKGSDGKNKFDATAQFTFKGTGFDIISRTDMNCGQISVAVYDSSNKLQANVPVINKGVGTLYQIPVISYTGLKYGTYTVKINVNAPQQYLGITGSTFYLDAIRIYNPMGLSTTDNSEFTEANNAYTKDKESHAFNCSIRDYILSIGNLNISESTGAVYVDTINNKYTAGGVIQQSGIKDFELVGPNEEVYLTPGKGIGFAIVCSAQPKSVQVEIKVPAPLSSTAKLLAQTSGNTASKKEITVKSATEMFYDITSAVKFTTVTKSGTTYYRAVVVLSNGLSSAASDIISVTNVKLTYSSSVKNLVEGKDKDTITTTGDTTTIINEDGDIVETPAEVEVGMMASWDIYCDVFDTVYTQYTASVPTYNVAANNDIVTTSCGKKVTATFTTSQFVDDLVIKDADGNPVKAEVSSVLDEDNLFTASYESAKVWTVTFDNPTGVYNYTVAAANGEGETAEITVNVKPVEAVSLSVYKAPAKTQYNYGEQIDPSGLELLVTYSDGTTKVVKSGYTLNTYKANKSGVRSVAVNYQGLQTSYKIKVKVTFAQVILTVLGLSRLFK